MPSTISAVRSVELSMMRICPQRRAFQPFVAPLDKFADRDFLIQSRDDDA